MADFCVRADVVWVKVVVEVNGLGVSGRKNGGWYLYGDGWMCIHMTAKVLNLESFDLL